MIHVLLFHCLELLEGGRLKCFYIVALDCIFHYLVMLLALVSGTAPTSLIKLNSSPLDASRFQGSGPEQPKLGRSKTEKHSHHRVLAEEAAELFNENTSTRQKVS